PRLSISISKISSSEITRGLTFRLCGEIGVITKFPDPGEIIGPPQLSEYAVEPVGVAIINPSAQYSFSKSPFKKTFKVIIEDVSRLINVTSLSAKLFPLNKGELSASTANKVLFSIVYSSLNNADRASSILSLLILAKKPNRPKLIPVIGMLES